MTKLDLERFVRLSVGRTEFSHSFTNNDEQEYQQLKDKIEKALELKSHFDKGAFITSQDGVRMIHDEIVQLRQNQRTEQDKQMRLSYDTLMQEGTIQIAEENTQLKQKLKQIQEALSKLDYEWLQQDIDKMDESEKPNIKLMLYDVASILRSKE